jgi:septal ring factor EnvC (AmiA/AmiB activator)
MAAVAPADFFSGHVPKPAIAGALLPEETIDSSVPVPVASSSQQALAAHVDACAAAPESTAPAHDGADPALASALISKEDKHAERRRKAEAKEEERAIKEAQRQARDIAKAAKAAELTAARERKRAEHLLREAAAEESRLAKKAEAERKEIERKAKLEEKESERERKVRCPSDGALTLPGADTLLHAP